MWRSRSVGSRSTPTVSQMSWPCAQASINRAVRNDFAPIDGPYHSIRASSAQVAAAAARLARCRRQCSSRSGADIARASPSVASSADVADAKAAATKDSRWATKPSGSSIASAAVMSKKARWPIWSRTAQRGDGVARSQSSAASGATTASRASCSATRSAVTEATVGLSMSAAWHARVVVAEGRSRRCAVVGSTVR